MIQILVTEYSILFMLKLKTQSKESVLVIGQDTLP